MIKNAFFHCQNERSSALWTPHHKKHTFVDEGKRNKKERGLHQKWMLYLKKLLGSTTKSLQLRLWREFQFGNPKVKLIH